MVGETLAATEISVTASLSMANINRGGGAATDESAINAIGPDVGKMATALAPPIRFETIGAAIKTAGKVTTVTATMATGTTGVIGIIGTVVIRGFGGAGPQLPC